MIVSGCSEAGAIAAKGPTGLALPPRAEVQPMGSRVRRMYTRAALAVVSLVIAVETGAATDVPYDRLALPLRFEPNVGQADLRYRFLGAGPGLRLAVGPQELVLAFDQGRGESSDARTAPCAEGSPRKARQPITMTFTGARSGVDPVALSRLPGTVSYFRDPDP